jgi:hypothetical protein
LPEVAIQAVGKVTDWITNLPEVAIQVEVFVDAEE